MVRRRLPGIYIRDARRPDVICDEVDAKRYRWLDSGA